MNPQGFGTSPRIIPENSEEINQGMASLTQIVNAGADQADFVSRLGPMLFQSWLVAANQGNLDAQCLAGFSYMLGAGAQESMKDGIEWLCKAANQGHSMSQFLLGMGLLSGEDGFRKNEAEGARLLEMAAATGMPRAQISLAGCYENGIGVSRNPGKSVELYTAAADQGSKEAQQYLAQVYMKGELVPKDARQVFYWVEKLAEQGDCWSQLTVGKMYVNGIGVEKNFELAKEWFKKVYLNFAADPDASKQAMGESMKADMLMKGIDSSIVNTLFQGK